MITVVLVGIIAACFGYGIGRALGLWKALLLAALSAYILLNVGWGIWIAEFPVFVLVGGLMSGIRGSPAPET